MISEAYATIHDRTPGPSTTAQVLLIGLHSAPLVSHGGIEVPLDRLDQAVEYYKSLSYVLAVRVHILRAHLVGEIEDGTGLGPETDYTTEIWRDQTITHLRTSEPAPAFPHGGWTKVDQNEVEDHGGFALTRQEHIARVKEQRRREHQEQRQARVALPPDPRHGGRRRRPDPIDN